MRRQSPNRGAVPLLIALVLVLGIMVASSLMLGTGGEAAAESAAALDTFESAKEGTYAKGVAKVDLFDPAGNENSGVSVDGDIIKITAAGVYSLSGTLTEGRIEIDTKGKVYLELNGVDVTSSSGPALSVTDAEKVTIVLTGGSSNSLTAVSDGSAALRSNDPLVFTGNGALTATANGGGISSDDDITINNGFIRVAAAGDGLAANDDITINGGDVSITACQDGLDSNGTIHINGGTVVAFGGTAQDEGGINARGDIVIIGGTVVAGGNAIVPLSNNSRQASLYLTSASIRSAGTTVRLQHNGQDVFSFTPEVAYQNILISSSILTSGVTYQTYLGDKIGNLVVASR